MPAPSITCRYESAKVQGSYDDETRRRENAKHSLERYMHYFERFDAHNQARQKAMAEAVKTQNEILEQLSDMTKTPTSQLKFIMDAWGQIVECRRMLKWTYAYGYYAFADDEDTAAQQQRQFFEFLQGDAEHSLEIVSVGGGGRERLGDRTVRTRGQGECSLPWWQFFVFLPWGGGGGRSTG